MKVLLILPPDNNLVEPFVSMGKTSTSLIWGFPIGLGYLASYLKKAGHTPVIMDCLKATDSLSEIQKKIKKINPDIVGINVMTPTARGAVAVAKAVKEINKKIPVVGGGPHATFDYDNLLKNYDFDYIVIGEGEITFLELVNTLAKKRKNLIKNISGITYKENNKIIKTSPRSLINNIDEIPFPARNLVHFEDYITDNLLPRAIEIMGSRGCSHRCIFCSSSHLFGRWRARTPENIVKEMKYLIKKYPQVRSFLFYDDNFTLSKDRVIKFCNLLIKEGLNKYSWDCLGRADQVTEEMLLLMEKAGCKKISYGIESGSPEILKTINKRLNLETARKTIQLTKKIGIEALAFMMIGNPGETRQTIKESICYAKSLHASSTLWSIAQIYPGTELNKMQPVGDFINYLYEPELRNPHPFTNSVIAVFENKGLGREELKRIHQKIFRDFTFYHFWQDPLGRIKHFFYSPKDGALFLLSLIKSAKAEK